MEITDNELITRFLGYTYTAEIWEDYSDIGGLYTNFKVYSKVPIWLDEDSLSQNFRNKFRGEYFLIEIGGYSAGIKSQLDYSTNWNSLIEVVLKLDIKEISSDIKEVYKLVIKKIKYVKKS